MMMHEKKNKQLKERGFTWDVTFELAFDYANRAKEAMSCVTVVPPPPLDPSSVLCPALPAGSNAGGKSCSDVLAPPRVRSRGRLKASRFKAVMESPGARKQKRKAKKPAADAPPPRRSRRNSSAAASVPKCRTCSSTENFASKCPMNNVAQPSGESARHCSSCGATGHNKSTCGRKSSYAAKPI